MTLLNLFITAFIFIDLLLLALFLSFMTSSIIKKNAIRASFQVQCSTGDSEVMVINQNLMEGETEESKASKVFEAFEMIQERRDINHKKWLEVKQKAIEENSKKSPEELKLRSVTEQPKNPA